jgi:hypothetical protein
MMDFHLDSSQDFYATGRVEYASEMSTRGRAAMRRGAYPVAFELLETSARAFPLPAVMTSAGVCLLLTLSPADAVFYFAASAGMSQAKARLRPMLLLAKAMLLAQEKVAGISILKEVMELHSIWLTGLSVNKKSKELLKANDVGRFHEMIDYLLQEIDKESDSADSQQFENNSVSMSHLTAIYEI